MKKPEIFKSKKELSESSLLFEDIIGKKEKTIRRVYLSAAVTGVIISILSLTAVITLLPLKETETRIFSVDNQTGRTEEIVTVNDASVTAEKALARYFTDTYIKAREGYNYFRLQQDYDTVMLFSAEPVATEYNAVFKTDKKPQNIYRKGEQTAKIEVLSKIISDSSNKSDPDKQASVRFKKTVQDIITGQQREEYWVLKMTYRFIPDAEMTVSERDKNPLGFVVTSYLTEKENRG